MSKMRILLVEDDMRGGAFLRAALTEAGHEIDWVETGGEGLEALKHNDYEAILLDLTVQARISGLDVATELQRRRNNTPVIILSGQHEVEQVVQGLDVADDYVTKPFRTQELLARLRAQVRSALAWSA